MPFQDRAIGFCLQFNNGLPCAHESPTVCWKTISISIKHPGKGHICQKVLQQLPTPRAPLGELIIPVAAELRKFGVRRLWNHPVPPAQAPRHNAPQTHPRGRAGAVMENYLTDAFDGKLLPANIRSSWQPHPCLLLTAYELRNSCEWSHGMDGRSMLLILEKGFSPFVR